MAGYFDNSATTKPSEKALKAFTDSAQNCYGNPASLHSMGTNSHILIEEAREIISKQISCEKNELIFTSGGTESNNIAIIGAALANCRKGKKIVITNIEHPSVDKTADYLFENGFEVIRLTVLPDGNFIDSEIESAIAEDTVLVSSMLVNNETGIILNTDKLKKAIRKNAQNCTFHIDAIQAFGKIDINANKLGCDLMSLSAHKIHGIKGVGALYKKKGTRLKTTVFGGGQESGIRSGTVPVELISAFGAAVSEIDTKATMKHFEMLRSELVNQLADSGYKINFSNCGQKGIVSLCFVGIKSEVLLHFLSDRGFFVSSGSACSKGKKSSVLKSLGLPDAEIDGTLRISFSKYNTLDEVKALADALKTAVGVLARKK